MNTGRSIRRRTHLLSALLVVLMAASCVEELRAAHGVGGGAAVGNTVQKSKARRRVRRRTRAVTPAPAAASTAPAADEPVKTREAPVVIGRRNIDAPAAAAESTPTQDEDTGRNIVRGGVLNGKAISKPAPPYPAIARAAGAQGTVTVQIVVDEEGRVISAQAVSGHPLLQSAAVEAAREARFSPTLLSGQPVKVSGVITYNFVLQ